MNCILLDPNTLRAFNILDAVFTRSTHLYGTRKEAYIYSSLRKTEVEIRKFWIYAV